MLTKGEIREGPRDEIAEMWEHQKRKLGQDHLKLSGVKGGVCESITHISNAWSRAGEATFYLLFNAATPIRGLSEGEGSLPDLFL